MYPSIVTVHPQCPYHTKRLADEGCPGVSFTDSCPNFIQAFESCKLDLSLGRLDHSFRGRNAETRRLPGRDIPDDFLTGVNTSESVFAYVASHAMSISEIPTITYGNQGGFNTLLRIGFPTDGRKLLARISLKDIRTVSRIECSVATMSFARYVRNMMIPTPSICVSSWNANSDNPVGAQYILQEYIDDVVEPWQV